MTCPASGSLRPSNPTPYHPNNIPEPKPAFRVLNDAGFETMGEFMRAHGLREYENEHILRAWEIIEGMREDDMVDKRGSAFKDNHAEDFEKISVRKTDEGEEKVVKSTGIKDADEEEEVDNRKTHLNVRQDEKDIISKTTDLNVFDKDEERIATKMTDLNILHNDPVDHMTNQGKTVPSSGKQVNITGEIHEEFQMDGNENRCEISYQSLTGEIQSPGIRNSKDNGNDSCNGDGGQEGCIGCPSKSLAW